MKKSILLTTAALTLSMAAMAQIGESKSKKIETTYTTTTRTVEVQTNKDYNRIYFGYAPTKFSADGESETLHGFDLGWMRGFNVTKGRRLPLYVEAGIAMNADFGECLSESDKLMNFEIPFGVTYRWNIPNTKIYVSPYFGFHFKINALWMDDDGDSYFDVDDTHRFQFGMQLGGHIDFNRFYMGIGWDKDFISIADIETRYDDYSLSTSGVRVNIGFTF